MSTLQSEVVQGTYMVLFYSVKKHEELQWGEIVREQRLSCVLPNKILFLCIRWERQSVQNEQRNCSNGTFNLFVSPWLFTFYSLVLSLLYFEHRQVCEEENLRLMSWKSSICVAAPKLYYVTKSGADRKHGNQSHVSLAHHPESCQFGNTRFYGVHWSWHLLRNSDNQRTRQHQGRSHHLHQLVAKCQSDHLRQVRPSCIGGWLLELDLCGQEEPFTLHRSRIDWTECHGMQRRQSRRRRHSCRYVSYFSDVGETSWI